MLSHLKHLIETWRLELRLQHENVILAPSQSPILTQQGHILLFYLRWRKYSIKKLQKGNHILLLPSTMIEGAVWWIEMERNYLMNQAFTRPLAFRSILRLKKSIKAVLYFASRLKFASNECSIPSSGPWNLQKNTKQVRSCSRKETLSE